MEYIVGNRHNTKAKKSKEVNPEQFGEYKN